MDIACTNTCEQKRTDMTLFGDKTTLNSMETSKYNFMKYPRGNDTPKKNTYGKVKLRLTENLTRFGSYVDNVR